MHSLSPESKSRLHDLCKKGVPLAGVVGGFIAAHQLYSADAFNGFLVNLGAGFFLEAVMGTVDYIFGGKKAAEPSEPRPVVDQEKVVQKLFRLITENGLDGSVINALGQLEPELAERIWQAYTADTERLKDETIRASAAYERLEALLIQPRFRVAILPSHLHRLLGGYMPHQLVERPELGPLTRELFSGRVRQAAILAQPLTGKSFLAIQAGMKWLSEKPGRAVAFLAHTPTAEDAAPLNALDPENHLVIIDPVSPEPLEDTQAANIVGLRSRVILCQRIGQSRYQEQVNELVQFLEAPSGGDFIRWNITAADSPPIGRDRVIVHLGPMPKETVFSMLSKARDVLDRQGRLTLHEDGKEALFQALQAFSGRQETSLLGLAKALILFALQKAGPNSLALTNSTVIGLLDEIGFSLTGPAGDAEWEKNLENLFGSIVNPDQKNVLLVMKYWRRFTNSIEFPLQALYAGYITLVGRDLRTVDHHLLQPLEAARILTKDNETESIRVWHPLQLEAIQDAYDYNARYEWMKNSLTKLKEFAFPADATLAIKAKRAAAMSELGRNLLIARVRESVIADILNEALEIYRRLVGENPKAYLPDMAMTANNLGNLLSTLREREAAKALYEEALEIYRRLAGENPKAYLPDMAMTANNLGNLLNNLGEREAAKALYEEALEIYRRLAGKNLKAYLPYVAMTANNLGTLMGALGEWEAAKTLYEEALKIRRHLAGETPKAHQPDVAMTANNLGTLMGALGEWEAAKTLYEEALKIDRRLARETPKAYLPNMAVTANNLGTLLNNLGEREAAKALVEEALEIRRRLANENPKAYLPDMAVTANNLGALLGALGEREAAKALYEEALEIYRRLAGENPKAYRPDVAMTANNLGTLLGALGEREAAKALYEEAIEIYRRLAGENPKAYKPNLAMTANNLGTLLGELGERDAAKTLYEEALAIRRRLAGENPKAYRPYVATTANNLGTLLGALGERDAAKALYEEALEIYRRLARENPKAYLPYVAMTVYNLALFHLARQQSNAAAPFTAEAITLHAVCTPMAPPVYGPRLQYSLAIARELYRAADFQTDRDAWFQSLKIALAEKLGQEIAEKLTGIITLSDEDLEKLEGEAKNALWLPEELWKGGA